MSADPTGAVPDLPPPGAAVDVVSRHWDDRFHREFTGHLLGADEWGVWVGVPAGTWLRTPRGGFASAGGVRLFPPGRWWSAWFSPGRVYVDITTPPEWVGTTVRIVDLDLDVERFGDGPVLLRDEDEFEVHQREMAYPPAVVAAAEAAAVEVLDLVWTGREAFSAVAASWVARAAAG